MENNSNSTAPSEDVSPATNGFDMFNVIVHAILFLFGVPGNCLILRVYWTKTRKTSTHVLIMALAWADLAVCLLRVSPISERALALAGVSQQNSVVFDYLWPFETTAIGTSILVTAVIAADRYDCICRPQRRYFTPRRSRIAAWVALLLSFATSIPAFVRIFDFSNPVLSKLQIAFQIVSFVTALLMIALCYGKVYATIRKHVRVGAVSRPTTRDEDSSKLDSQWSTRLPRGALATGDVFTSDVDKPVSTVIIQPSTSKTNPNKVTDASTVPVDGINDSSNEPGDNQLTPQSEQATPKGISVETVSRAAMTENRNRRHEPSNMTRRAPQRVGAAVLQRKTTRMLFITSVVFLLTWLPYLIWFAMEVAAYAGVIIEPIYWDVTNEVLVTVYINNAVNPLIYGLANRRFRKDCKEVLNKIRLR